jgi:hypothetical protein
VEEEDNYSPTCACKEESRLLLLELAVPPRPRPLALGVVARGLALGVVARGLAGALVLATGFAFGFGGAGGFATGVVLVARGLRVREPTRVGPGGGGGGGGGGSGAAPPWGAASTSGPF